MALTLSPAPFFTALDDSGVAIPGALIETYASGTSTPLATYSNSTGSSANANPVVCDAAGRCTMYLLPTAYKFIYTTAAGVVIRTIDPVGSVPQTQVDLDIQGVAGEALTAGNAVYVSDGSGSLTAGRWYKADSDQTYSSSNAQAVGFAVESIASAATGSIRQGGRVTGLSGLTAGSIYYISSTAGGLTATPPTNQRSMGIADTTTSLVMTYTPPPASATIAGVVTAGTQTFGGAKTFAAAAIFSAQPTVIIGTGSGSARMAGTLNVNTTTTGNVGVGEDTLATYTVPANTLAASGQSLRITAWGQFAATANAKQVRVRFGGIGGTIVAATGSSATYDNMPWQGEVYIVRTGAATQVSSGWIGIHSLSNTIVRAAPTQTLSGTVDIVVTGEATANDDVQIYGLIVEAVN